MEFMLQNHVFPLFRSELGYMRARVGDNVLTGRPQICVIPVLCKVALNYHKIVILAFEFISF